MATKTVSAKPATNANKEVLSKSAPAKSAANSGKEILIKNLEVARKSANDTLKKVLSALAKKDLDAYGKHLATLNQNVKDINTMQCKVSYSTFLESDHPIIAAVKQFYVPAVRVKEKRNDDGVVTAVELDTKKTRIDLGDFCTFGELSQEWVDDASHLLALLALRETDVFNISPEKLNAKSFYFIEQVKAKQDGKTPDSNTQVTKLLQKIIDETIFVDNGEGKNVYKCTVHDLTFIHDAITKMDAKEKCTITTMNPRQFQSVMMSILAHVLGEAYKVKVPKIKERR